jgi:predicted anti-sigma-YlaC factor YlaD
MKCLYYQWRISRAVDDGDDASLPTRHMAACPACRAFHDNLRLIERRLLPVGQRHTFWPGPAQGARPSPAACRPTNARRVPADNARGEAAQDDRSPRARHRLPMGWSAAALAAAAIVILGLIVIQWRHDRPLPPPAVVERDHPPPHVAPLTSLSLPSRDEALAALTRAATRPFVQEFENASHDALAAAQTVRSLVMIDLCSRGRRTGAQPF